MKKKKNHILKHLLIALLLLCLIVVWVAFTFFKDSTIQMFAEKTTMTLPLIDAKTRIVTDSIRHYFPIIQGETLKIAYTIENKSDTTLVIQEVQTSCGCVITRDDLPIVILPNTTGAVHVDFNTEKNTGYVCHYIDCFGNFCNADSINTSTDDTHPQWAKFIELRFDTNIVPPADYTHDYEEVWHEQAGLDGTIRDFVDGTTSQKNYWVDKDTEDNKKKK